jgi:hypothetical protein
MLGKFLRIRATFFEDLRVRFGGTFRVSYEAYWINVAQLFQYCGKGEPGSSRHKIFPSGLDILA